MLLVEDEPALATAVADALTDAGFRVDRAGDGEEALGRVREHTYDLVICDLKMPRLDGAAFYREVAHIAPALQKRMVFVTGDVAGTDAERFLEETGCRWLAKPFRLSDLLRAAREVAHVTDAEEITGPPPRQRVAVAQPSSDACAGCVRPLWRSHGTVTPPRSIPHGTADAR